MLNGSNLRGALFALACAAFVGFWSLALSGSFSIPNPQKATVSNTAGCSTHECRADAAAEAVAKYTEVLAWFTAVLAIASAVQGLLILNQYRLSRTEFMFVHRPRLIVRDVRSIGADV